MAKVAREVERKYEVSEDFVMPDLTLAGTVVDDGPASIHLRAVYYDTPDLRLAREGMTLRRREGGDDAGWHLKLPVASGAGSGGGGSMARDEVHLPLDAGADGDAPAELVDLVAAYVRTASLAPVRTLVTQRQVHRLLAADERELAEVVLDEVTVLRGECGRDALLARFREVEVEVREATPGELADVVQQLRGAGAVPGRQVPKLVRALGPLAAAAPDVPVPGALTASSAAAEAVGAHIAEQVRALRAADVGVRRGQDDAIHQMRVAARRLRSGLRVFRPLVDRTWADDLRAELAWLAGELGAARDGEVLLARLADAADALPEQAQVLPARAVLVERLGQQVATAEEGALSTLRSARYTLLVDQLVAAAHLPATTAAARQPCGRALPPLVAKAWKDLARQVAALDADGDDDAWHEARKGAKKVRYAAEAVTPALGKPAKRLARQTKKVTEVLGEHQDAAVAATALAELAPASPAQARFGLGVLYAGQRDAVHRSREQFLDAWPSVAHRKHRRWLDGAARG